MLYTEAVTGREAVARDRAHQALIDFYHAFNTRNMEKMRTCWSNNSAAVMSNPLGGIKNGWDEIETLYANLFNGSARVNVEFYDYTLVQSPGMFWVAGRERGSFRCDDLELPLDIRTTRIFTEENGGWSQLHHHGSITDPELLARYRAAFS